MQGLAVAFHFGAPTAMGHRAAVFVNCPRQFAGLGLGHVEALAQHVNDVGQQIHIVIPDH